MDFLISNSIYILETVAICAFAFSGMVMARQKNFDPVGVSIMAFVTALGGGTFRDIVLDNHPLYWIAHSEYLLLIFGLSIIFYFFTRVEGRPEWLIIPDAMGIALFTVTSAQMAMAEYLPLIVVAILATSAATFGGLIRDILCHEVPMVFQKVSLYASASFAGVWVYIGCISFDVNESLAMLIGVLFIFILRLLAVRFNLRFR
ncbi:trimeric intracellular cation channel family protein [bacterium]|jgi:uncharacterized membrane protein YeiH|nr:trimeric intracellular cation channel family protein [bacterium]